MSMFKTKKKVGKCLLEVDESASDAEDNAAPDEELEVDEDDEDDDDSHLNDETRDAEDNLFLDTLEIPAEKLRNIGDVSDSEWKIARRALRKVN